MCSVGPGEPQQGSVGEGAEDEGKVGLGAAVKGRWAPRRSMCWRFSGNSSPVRVERYRDSVKICGLAVSPRRCDLLGIIRCPDCIYTVSHNVNMENLSPAEVTFHCIQHSW